MDYEDIIKLEEQSPIYSTGNGSTDFKHCMASFYEQDSEFDHKEIQQEINFPQNLSFEKAIEYIQNFINIIDTPLEDIMIYLDRLQFTQNIDKTVLKKHILKRKNLLKRYRAKNRQPRITYSDDKAPLNLSINLGEAEAEIKKKRNRVSAQISRDRKKQYFKELQEKNLKLQEQIIKSRLQNERLKRQIKQRETKPKVEILSDTISNKLTKLLILLGIICLIGILKDTFISTKDQLSKVSFNSKIETITLERSLDQAKLFEESHCKISQFLNEPELEKELLENQNKTIFFQTDSGHIENRKEMFFSRLIEKLSQIKQSILVKNVEL